MSYNPLELEYQSHSLNLKQCNLNCARLRGAIQSVEKSIASAQKAVLEEESWHYAQDESALRQEEGGIRAELAKMCNEKLSLQLAIGHAESKQAQLRSTMGSDFNPLNWFRSRHKADKKELSSWSDSESINREAVRTISARISDKEKTLKDICTKQTRFCSFENTLAHLTTELRDLRLQVQSLSYELAEAEQKRDRSNSALKTIKKQYDRVAELLKPLQSQIDKCYSDIESSNDKLDIAAKFESELTAASSPRERKMIHTSCERQLGDGSPSRVRERQIGVIEGLQRTLEKLHKRASRVGHVASLEIKHIVIDGSNIMNADDRFIGLSALDSLVSELSRSYTVDIFFDPGAIGVLQMSRSDLLSHFPDSVGVHITAGEADETILNYAKSSESIVISRDAFSEFQDKPVVAEGRVFKPEILDTRLMIIELDLDLSYESAS